MIEVHALQLSELSFDEMVEVSGGEPRTFWYRVGQVGAEVAEFFVGVWDGLNGK